jgi:hypothetical protein
MSVQKPFCFSHLPKDHLCQFVTDQGVQCKRGLSGDDSFCYAHRSGAFKVRDWLLEYDLTKPHVSCLCPEAVLEHPCLSKVLFRENSEDANLPLLIQMFLRRDIPDYFSVMRNSPPPDLCQPDKFLENLLSMTLPCLLEEAVFDEDMESSASVIRTRRCQWKNVFDVRNEDRIETLARVKNKVATLAQLSQFLKSIGRSVLSTKKACSISLLKFYKQEWERRTSKSWKTSSLQEWNMSHLAQMLKVRYRRKYSTALIKLYAKDPQKILS